PASFTFEGTREKLGWVREAAGDRFNDLVLNVYPSGVAPAIVDDPLRHATAFAESLTQRSGVAISAEEILDSPHFFVNTIDGHVEKFTRLRSELGISSIMVGNLGEL